MDKISYIKTENGAQRLYVHGKPLPGLAYITYLTDKNCYRDFADAGYRLFSFPVFFGHQALNERSQLPVFTQGIFDGETPDFSRFDRDMAQLLDARPDAYIFPRVNVSTPKRWEDAHPDELNYTGILSQPESKPRACFSSDLWAQEVKDMLRIFISHIEKKPYRDHIIGYQIAGGNTEEWFPFDMAGSVGPRSDEKFAAYVKKTGSTGSHGEYMAFLSQVLADRLCEFSHYMKELTDYRYVVGCFYGYTFSCPQTYTNHHALKTVLECPDIDFICSPISYDYVRQAGRDHLYMLPVDSVKLHSKLYFTENDTRTHLSQPVNNMPWYNKPLWFGPETEAQTLDILKMHFAKSLLHGHAGWWFDMWGGWFQSSGYMAFMEKALKITRDAMVLPLGSTAEVAVFADEKAYCKACDDSLSRKICQTLHTVSAAGIPYDVYLAEDFPQVDMSKYKAIVLLEPAATDASQAVAASGLPLLKINAANLEITGKQLRAFCESAGVHLYSRNNLVVYANESYLFIHTVQDGQQQLYTKENTALTDVFTGLPFECTFNAPTGKSYLLKKN